MEKTFTLTIKIKTDNTPQNWIFSEDVSGIEQLAIWTIISKLSERQIQQIINHKPLPAITRNDQ